MVCFVYISGDWLGNQTTNMDVVRDTGAGGRSDFRQKDALLLSS
jgi:hypothetical protein